MAANTYQEDITLSTDHVTKSAPVVHRESLTTTTWADLKPRSLSRGNAPRGWEALADLAHEAHELTRGDSELTLDAWRVLVDGAANGMPVVLEHVHGVPGGSRRERTVRTYVIESVRPELGVYGAVRAHCWGFTVNLALSELVSASTPEATYTYEEV